MSEALSPEDRARLETLFERAADLPSEERMQWAARECGANAALHGELVRLLRGLSRAGAVERLRGEAPQRIGTRIDRYRLLEKLGEGGMGTVYLAEQSEPVARRVALKIIRYELNHPEGLARFELERQVLAQMSHPNVAQVLDGGAAVDGSPYFVMEFVAGEPLTQYCDRHRLSTRERLGLFLGVCEGVQHAHQKGVIHRDLKPSNLLVTEVDGRPVPKVIDFGVARATTGPLADRTLQTMLGQVVGTLDYMSPEQADAASTGIDTRTDIYSLGVILYQLLSGLLPFDHKTLGAAFLAEVQRVIRESVPPTPSRRLRRETGTAHAVASLHGTSEQTLLRELAGDLDWVCMKALEKDPARRYQSASEFASDLRRHLAHEPVLAGKPSAIYRARKFVRRHRIGVLTGGLVTVGLIVGVLGIAAGRRVAEAKTRELLQLSDGERWRELAAEADTLWPPHPARIGALEDWLLRARAVLGNLPAHRATLALLAEDSATSDPETTEARWQRRVLSELVTNLDDLQSTYLSEDALTPEHGWSVPKRLALAQQLAARFDASGDCAREWAARLPEIRADYPELDLRVQAGLLPVGRDPESGLWEFAHLLSGEPARREAGQLVMRADTGLVLVLVRGGTYLRGAQNRDVSGAHYYELADDSEGPPSEVTLAPYFISKFELTQSQWERTAGSNPSRNERGPSTGADFALHPVNQVTQFECTRLMTRLGLVLPHEDQWEHAARAGTPDHDGGSLWGTGDGTTSGDDPRSLIGKANLFDASVPVMLRSFFLVNGGGPAVDWSDGFAMAAPIGSCLPNAFGLHDMYGNVTECCSNNPGEPGWGGRSRPGLPHTHVARGGNFASGSESARSAFRAYKDVVHSMKPYSGLRPARAVDP